MSSLICYCGARIADATDHLPYKGAILPDTEREPLFDRMVDLVNGLTAAIRRNDRQGFVKSQGYNTQYEWDDGSLLFNLFLSHYHAHTKPVFQCDSCGRILIRQRKGSKFIAFKPESDDWKNILSDLG